MFRVVASLASTRRFATALAALVLLVPRFAHAASEKVVAVSASQSSAHLLYLKADRTLWGTGANESGQLGDGTTDNRNRPVLIATDVVSLAAGGGHTMFVKADGTLWATGSDFFGQLGDASRANRRTPVQVMTDVAAVWCGAKHTLVLGRDGTLFAMGDNLWGQLGDGSGTKRNIPVPIAPSVLTASGGAEHTLYVTTTHEMWGAGLNDHGQLGGDPPNQPAFLPSLRRTSVASVAGGGSFSAYLDLDAQLWTSGLAADGVLGNGVIDAVDFRSPVALEGMDDITAVATGMSHTLVLTAGKLLMAFGRNFNGCLGDGTTVIRSVPIAVPTSDDVLAIAAGLNFSAFVTNDGVLWTMGFNHWGQLGDGTNVDRFLPVAVDGPYTDAPKAVLALDSGATAITRPGGDVPAGTLVAPGLTIASSVATLPRATVSIAHRFQPAQDGLSFRNDGATMGDIAAAYDPARGVLSLVSAGGHATVAQWQAALRAVRYTNSLASPATGTRLVQFRVNDGVANSLAVLKTVSVSAVDAPPSDLSLSHATVYQASGVDAAVGTLSATDPDSTSFTYSLVAGAGADDNARFNLSGATLRANDASQLAPGRYRVRLQASDSAGATFAKAFVVTVAAAMAPPPAVVAFDGGAAHTLFVQRDGTVWAVGDNAFGQLGDGTAVSRATPVLIARDIVRVAAGAAHSLFVGADGSLWAAGANDSGQLGDGTTTTRPALVRVAGNVLAADAGRRHSAFVTNDGSLWTMGDNTYGQLGDGTTTARVAPVQVASGVASVATGDSHTLFVKTDGSLWAMGLNVAGQLGDASITNRKSPVLVATGVQAVFAGRASSLFLKSDHSLWGMGYNDSGQLGTGDLSSHASPVPIATGILAAAIGADHSVFLAADGTAWATGANSRGQLGTGDATDRSTPVQFARGVAALATGADFTLLAGTDGALRGTGANTSGQLGNGTATDRSAVAAFVRGSPTSGPAIVTQPANQSAYPGQTFRLATAIAGTDASTVQWQRNGAALAGATGPTLTVANLQPAQSGLYTATAAGAATRAAIVGLFTTDKVVGAGSEVGSNIVHPNGNLFDQILVDGAAETITADPGQITRTSFVDLDDDIVQVEFSGPGSLSLVLASPTGPELTRHYHQDTAYMKGHAALVIVGADERTNVSVFSVGRATAFDPTGAYNILLPPGSANNPANNGSLLFAGHSATAYDGIAGLAFIAISSANGRFGGVRAANATCFAHRGLTGLYAPGVQFTGPVFLGNIVAADAATPVLVLGAAADTRIAGGDLLQLNSRPVIVSGLTALKFVAGSDSHGRLLPAQSNRGTLLDDGTDVTALVTATP